MLNKKEKDSEEKNKKICGRRSIKKIEGGG